MIDFERARTTMIDNQLRTSGVTDRRVIAAIGAVPRELFVPALRKALAYTDEEHVIGNGRRLAAPAPFARLLQLAAVGHAETVLVAGCGTGYSAALLSRLAQSVVALEPDADLAAKARDNLAALGSTNVTVVAGPVETSGKGHGPYDVIILEGLVAAVPDQLLAQLKPEGRVLAVVGRPGRPGVAHVFMKSGKDLAARAEFDAYLPPLPGQTVADSFVF